MKKPMEEVLGEKQEGDPHREKNYFGSHLLRIRQSQRLPVAGAAYSIFP